MSVAPATLFATSPGVIPEFQASPTQSCLFFCEAEKQLLLTPDQGMPWDLPGDNFEGECTQEVAFQIFNRKTQLPCTSTDLVQKGICYLRHEGTDRIIHLFRVTFASKPTSLFDRNWIPLYAFQALDKDVSILRLDRGVLKEGRLDTFNIAFGDRVWHRVADASQIILEKGDQRLSFDFDRRLVITILGKPLSGKFVQAELLAKILGLKILLERGQCRTLSLDDICREETRDMGDDAPLQKMMDHHDEDFADQPYPCQVTTGLLSHGIYRLADLRTIVLRGYPNNLTQCGFLLNIFLRSTDRCFALSLEPSDDDVRAHPKFSENDSATRNEYRLTEFNQNQDTIKKSLIAQRHQIEVLQLPSAAFPSLVFHHISDRFQNWLDRLVAEQAALARSTRPSAAAAAAVVAVPAKPMAVSTPPVATVTSQRLSLRNPAIFASALIIGFIAGAVFIRSR